MADQKEQLVLAKKKLVQALGDKEKEYWNNMKAWFKCRITKEEFDQESRRLLSNDLTHLHNQFLFAVLTKCQIVSSSDSKDASLQRAKKNKRLQTLKRKFEHKFEAIPPSPKQLNPAMPPSSLNHPLYSCAKTLDFPNKQDMTKLVAVIAWECGLNDASDNSTILVMEALKVFLKNLLSLIFSRRSAYKLHNGSIAFAMGCPPTNPYLIQGSKKHRHRENLGYSDPEQLAIEELGKCQSKHTQKPRQPVNMYDLLHTLQYYRMESIPIQSIHSMAVERVISNLHHPSNDDLQHKQEYLTATKIS